MCVGGLGAAYLYTGAAEAHSVIKVNGTVARGDIVEASDVSIVSVGQTGGAATVPSEELDRIVGQEALTDLPADSLLTPGSVGASALADGTVQLGLKLAQGRIPMRTMPAGVPVLLVAVPTQAADGRMEQVASRTVKAVVANQPVASADGASWLLDVTVPASDAETVARLAAGDQLVVVREAGR